MTEQEITTAISKWRKYALVGDPNEPDYGSDKPAGVHSASLERNYESPQIWHTPEPDLHATKADYEAIEPIYRAQSEPDKITLRKWYFEPREEPPSLWTRDTVARFRRSIRDAHAA